MSSKDHIWLKGKVLDRLPSNVFKLELANGHRLLAYVPRRFKNLFEGTLVGMEVTVEISPYDFSTGKIILDN